MLSDSLFSYVHPAQYQSLFHDIKKIDTSRGAILRSIENEYGSLRKKVDGEKEKRKIILRRSEDVDREKSIKSDRSAKSFKTRITY